MGRRIIDCVMLLDELDLLEFRLRLLDGLVDKTVVVEANTTFSGKPKPYYFEHERIRFQKYNDKIAYLQVDMKGLKVEDENWVPHPLDIDQSTGHMVYHCDLASPFFHREYAQRDALGALIDTFTEEDRILISDIDEIPARETVEMVKTDPGVLDFPFACHQRHFMYSLHWNAGAWLGTIVTDLATLEKRSPQMLRASYHVIDELDPDFRVAPNAGWHLGFFRSVRGIQDKIASYAHQEYNIPKFNNFENIKRARDAGTDMFGIGLNYQPFDPETLPDYFRAIIPEYPQIFRTADVSESQEAH